MANIDEVGMQKSLDYLYGFVPVGNRQLYFINSNDIYLGKSSTVCEDVNCTTPAEKQKCDDIKAFFNHNIKIIYDNDYNNETAKYNDKLLLSDIINRQPIKKKRRARNGGNPTYEFKLPKDDVGGKTKAYENLYERLNDPINERSIFTTTREPENVKLLVLCYFHIDDFDMRIPAKGSELEDQDVNSKISYFKKKNYQIISEQEVIHTEQFETTIRKMEENTPIYPVNIDVERDNDGNNRYYLSDGNHRIAALKALGYDGYVPAFVCSYIPEFKIKSYLIPGDVGKKRDRLDGGSKPKGRRILKSYSYL